MILILSKKLVYKFEVKRLPVQIDQIQIQKQNLKCTKIKMLIDSNFQLW